MADIEMVIDSIRVSLKNHQHVVILRERQTDRYLPIWVGPAEADSISMKIQNVDVSRPMTHDFACSIITTLGGRLKSVVINKIENDTFYAKAIIKTFCRKKEIDCRPSDAIAVAVREGVPIFANDQVLLIAGITLASETGKALDAENRQYADGEQNQSENLWRFSDSIKNIFNRAEEQAAKLNSGYIGTGHLLLALLSQAPNKATDILDILNVDKNSISSEVVSSLSDEQPTEFDKVSLNDNAKRTIEYCVEEAQRFSSKQVHPEHLLLGLLREENGIAGKVLGAKGINFKQVQENCPGGIYLWMNSKDDVIDKDPS
jgi:bifunctional DNase/RNase